VNDRDVRTALLTRLRCDHANDADTVIVEEMGVWSGSVRVDVAVINGELHGIELKSERDTLERLPNQASLYSEVFDRVTLVVASRHFGKARAIVPEWWGLTEASRRSDGRTELREVRPSTSNPSPQALQIARLLWKSEVLSLLEQNGLLRGYRSKPIEVLAQRLSTSLPLKTLRDSVRTALKARPGRLGQLPADDSDMTV